MQQEPYAYIADRVGTEHMAKRMQIQVEHAASLWGGAGLEKIHFENIEIIPIVLRWLLKATFLFGRAQKNALDYRIERVTLSYPNLPREFDNLKILQLSDLHVDETPDGGDRLLREISGLEFDLCLMTGDYRFSTYEDDSGVYPLMEKVIRQCECKHGIYGILGNHDFIECVHGIEQAGMRMLINESVSLSEGGGSIKIIGLDDAHFYGAHDMSKALSGTTDNDFRILLVHSPELYREAASEKIDLYLCGHTHAGQLCFPGGLPVMTNAHCPRKYISGTWQLGRTTGHTSRGTGSSALFVRAFCPPEITLITLQKRS